MHPIKVKGAAAENPPFLFRDDKVADVFGEFRQASRKQRSFIGMRLDDSVNFRNVRQKGLSRYKHSKIILYLCIGVYIYSSPELQENSGGLLEFSRCGNQHDVRLALDMSLLVNSGTRGHAYYFVVGILLAGLRRADK